MAFEYHYISGDSHLEVDTAQWKRPGCRRSTASGRLSSST